MINLEGKSILITGGSGTWGTAFCEYIKAKKFKPQKITIFSRCPLKQDNLREKLGDLDYMVYRLGNVTDEDRIIQVSSGIDIVIHAAALKFIEKCAEDPFEAKKINVDGTENIIKAALYRKIPKTILISTDKAVEAITYYGKTKAMAEDLILGGNKYKGKDDIRFSVCRYGNVIASSGSAVPIFKELKEKGAKYLPVTDERMTRFFYPVKDAIEFVLDCIEKMQGGEIYIPKIKSVKITDLCKAFDMPYKIVGLRGAEKIHEKMDANYSSDNNEFYNVDEIKELIGG